MSASGSAAQGFGFGIGCVAGVALLAVLGTLLMIVIFAIGIGGGGGGGDTVSAMRAECADGNGGACDALLLLAPFGSEDSAFAFTCGGRSATARAQGVTCAQLIGVEDCVGILCDQEE